MSGNTIIRLIVGFLLGATGIHASCPIELSPPSVVVKHGASVSVNCTTSETHEGMGWEAQDGGTQLIENVNHVVWTVGSLTKYDASPLCYMLYTNGTQCEKNLPVVVYTFPDTITISSNADSAVMYEGQQYTITCDIRHIAPVEHLTVLWYKGNDTKPIPKSFDDPKDNKKPKNVSANFTFNAGREYDGVHFRCEAFLNLGPEGPQNSIFSEAYPIKVHYGPDITCSDMITIWEGQNLEDQCSVTGNPSPTIAWFKDGLRIDPADALLRHNAGLYTIEAKGYINTNRTLHVSVIYGPEIVCPSTYVGIEYTTINITCSIIGYPSPSITTYKDGEEMSLPENLTRHDEGLYTIIASNEYSNVSHNLRIDVSYPPSQISELEDAEADVGSNVELKCVSKSKPPPEYSWIYFHDATNVKVTNEDNVSILHIRNANAHNTGSYTCNAGNNQGNVSRTARVTVKGVTPGCPVEITPERMVVQYRGIGVATCKSTANPSSTKDIYWRVPQGKVSGTQWSVDIHEDWDPRPVCVGTFVGIGECEKPLDFTMYKSPDSVSIHVVNQTGPLVEGTSYQLQCNIINVAPVEKLTVRWLPLRTFTKSYSNETTRHETPYDTSSMRAPYNVSSTISITVDRSHNGAQFRCEALLDLGEEGPLTMASSPLNIAVYYEPTINTTKLPKKIPVFRGYPVDLVCEADGNPPPRIQWFHSSVLRMIGGNLTVSEAGRYICNATNDLASRTVNVEVILKEDYLPLIAGFVAVTVVVISVIFVFIYSIYYKNTRIRSYSLKKPKLSTQNGNVAHNGLDMQQPIPMTKLS